MNRIPKGSWLVRIAAALAGDRRGAILAELAATLPVLVLMTLAGVEVSRYALLNQKLDRVATSTGDLVAQAQSLTNAQLTDIYSAAGYVSEPFALGAKGVIIVSSVSLTGGVARLNWQSRGGGTLGTASQVGVAGGLATLPAGMIVRAGETIIIAEVYFDFEPSFIPAVAPARRVYHRAFFRPRLGTLTSLS